ncbi:MAG: hypothetical protein LBR53_05795 [Deltaproteobacteria bacterium]|jgi:hypothetical protein|nr:hypothetical protein [Deltaproteobacteria bacterium]
MTKKSLQKPKESPSYLFISSMMLDGYDFVYRSVPPTSYTQYISGRTALNLESPSTDTIGSTDPMEYFFCFPDKDVPLTLWGNVSEKFRNTLHIYEQWGIHDDYANILWKTGFDHNFKKVYVADHYRAICDIIYAQILSAEPFMLDIHDNDDTFFTTNWIVAENIVEIDKCFYLLDKINEMARYLPQDRLPYLKKWIEFERDAIILGGG